MSSSSRGPYFSCSAKPERVARHETAQSPRLFTAKPVLGAPRDVDDELSEHGVPPQLALQVEAVQKERRGTTPPARMGSQPQ